MSITVSARSYLDLEQKQPEAHQLSPTELHKLLSNFVQKRLVPTQLDIEDLYRDIKQDAMLRKLELDFLEKERSKISQIAAQAPTQANDFVDWYEDLEKNGPGQYDPLHDWIAETATRDELQWFIRQEMVGEAGFDDLIALTQLRMPTTAKMEMAVNYWDEMGRGRVIAMHGPMLKVLGDTIRVKEITDITWESLALGNVMAGLAMNRNYAFQSIGCLGAVEMTAPARCDRLVIALERLGFTMEEAVYYRVHAGIDRKHSKDWNREVLTSLVAEDGSRARHIAEGALMRLNAGALTFDRYRKELGVSAPLAHIC
jgi:hypothetical protein